MEHDYKKIGLKSGLEIHQQLNTNKLFCDCPSILRTDEPKYTIERKLNPVIGETGEIDIAATHEKEKGKKFIYQVYDTNCLVELDEEPPHKINKEALKIALQIAILLNCKIFPIAQVMRKTVIDGSNTTGFQRTVLIAHDGYIKTSAGKITIDAVMLEEDSARSVSEDENSKTYKLDRLGIPLVEIATGPHMHTPEEIKEAALKLGEILRACNVKRGIGTIRQDVNISIKGSKRVEIKGFQDPKMMIKTINKEIERQQECIKQKSCRNEVRGALPDGTSKFQRPMPSAARMYPETDIPLLKISRDLINEIKKNLPKLTSEHRAFLDDFGLDTELVKLILKKNKVEDFKTLIQEHNNPNLVAKMLTLFQSQEKIEVDKLEEILEAVAKKEIAENNVKTIMQKIAQGKSLKEASEKADINLKKEAKKIIKEKPNLSQGAYMGLLMGKFKGQLSGKEVSDTLKELM
jgi:Glu-tRNA(Gln) amidotransferase subunit E-like FAD-binding protein